MFGSSSSPSTINYQSFGANNDLLRNFSRENYSTGNRNMYNIDLNYRRELDTQGSELLATLSFSNHPSNSDVGHAPLLNALKPTTHIVNEYRVNLLGFGFRLPDGYFTFGLSERYKMGLNIPRSLVSLLLDGAPDTLSVNRYNLRKLGGDVSAYLEMAFGYSRQIDETCRWPGQTGVVGFQISTLGLR